MTKYNEIFLAVVGITPQIFTECLYYYYSEYYKQNRHFDRIKVFTTLQGQEKLLESLFSNKIIHKLENALELAHGTIPFLESDIVLFSDHSGKPILDLRTTEQIEDTVKVFYDELRRWTSDNNNRVTSTISGGRKPQSIQMALAFQLYARNHDELIHIIAPDDKMDPKNPESKSWHFPSNPSDPEQQLEVSHVPILKVGRYLSSNLNLPPVDLIENLQSELIEHSPIDEFIINGTRFISGNESIKLSPLFASYLRHFIRVRLNSGCDRSCNGCVKCFIKNTDLPDVSRTEILDDHKMLYGFKSGKYEITKEARDNATILELADYIRGYISKIKTTIRKADISNRFRSSIQIRSLKLEPGNRQLVWHGVTIDPEIIIFDDNVVK